MSTVGGNARKKSLTLHMAGRNVHCSVFEEQKSSIFYNVKEKDCIHCSVITFLGIDPQKFTS